MKIYLLQRQIQGHSSTIWETIEALSTERKAIERKINYAKLDHAYAFRVEVHTVDDYFFFTKIGDKEEVVL